MTAKTTTLHSSYPEVHSIEESLAILDKYKNELTPAQYKAICSNIGNFAIEDMYLNEQDIIRNIQIEQSKKSVNDLIEEQKKAWGLL